MGQIRILDPSPHEQSAGLPDQAGEREAPELERLKAFVAEHVVGDRLQIGARGAQHRRPLEGPRVGVRELERPGVGHDRDEGGGRHVRSPGHSEGIDQTADHFTGGGAHI